MIEKIVVGADEAGRGLIIGPLVICACALNIEKENSFRNEGVRDSKTYTTELKLKKHEAFIKKHCLAWSEKILSPEILNNFNKNKMTVDEAEAFAFYQALIEIKKKYDSISEYQVDNFQAVKKLQELMEKNNDTMEIKLIVEPRAESRYIAVAAASVLARMKTEEELRNIRNRYGNFGSGSTNDERTIQWLKNYYEKNLSWPPTIVRTYWKTISRIEKENKK